MKKIYYTITALIIFNATAMQAITGVYAYNNTSSPVILEVTVHYYRKKIPSSTAYGGYTITPSNSTETLSIPLHPNKKNALAESLLIDRITVEKAIITTQSGTVTVPIGRTFALTTGMESHYDIFFIAIYFHPDISFTIKEERY
jgi:hypothetical protein